MTNEVQTYIALGIVVLTAALLLWRRLRRRGCGGHCGCGITPAGDRGKSEPAERPPGK